MSIRRYFSDIIDLRPGEGVLTLLMGAYYFFILVSFYFLKPARDSLFLVKLSPTELPFVFILTALAALPVTAIYTRASRKFKISQLITFSTIFMIANLAVLRWLVTLEAGWVYYLFYAWVGIFGILVTAQFWLLANAIYDAAQAKRIFSMLGAAGIVGAFAGGEITGFVVDNFQLRTENLLVLCAAVLVLCVVLANLIWRKKCSDDPEPAEPRHSRQDTDSTRAMIAEIKKSRHLLIIVAIIAVFVMVSTFVDYQFKEISYESYSNSKEGLTSFFGKFYGRVSLLALFLQVFVTYRLLRGAGVARAILVLPTALLVGSGAILVAPVLISAVFLKGSESSLEYSIDKISRELLFLPIPLNVKKRTKLFIDIFVDRWFRGVAGALLLICTTVLAISAQYLSVIVIGLVVIWIILALMARREYVHAFRLALERREIDVSQLQINIDDSATVKTLVGLLKSDNDRQVSYALDMLKSAKKAVVIESVAPLLHHSSAEVRRKSVELLQRHHATIE